MTFEVASSYARQDHHHRHLLEQRTPIARRHSVCVAADDPGGVQGGRPNLRSAGPSVLDFRLRGGASTATLRSCSRRRTVSLQATFTLPDCRSLLATPNTRRPSSFSHRLPMPISRRICALTGVVNNDTRRSPHCRVVSMSQAHHSPPLRSAPPVHSAARSGA
jgi:hypothetical protein